MGSSYKVHIKWINGWKLEHVENLNVPECHKQRRGISGSSVNANDVMTVFLTSALGACLLLKINRLAQAYSRSCAPRQLHIKCYGVVCLHTFLLVGKVDFYIWSDLLQKNLRHTWRYPWAKPWEGTCYLHNIKSKRKAEPWIWYLHLELYPPSCDVKNKTCS